MTGDLFIAVFSHRDVIPEKYRIAALIEQREYLCDGAIKNWAGPQQDVLSPICKASMIPFSRDALAAILC